MNRRQNPRLQAKQVLKETEQQQSQPQQSQQQQRVYFKHNYDVIIISGVYKGYSAEVKDFTPSYTLIDVDNKIIKMKKKNIKKSWDSASKEVEILNGPLKGRKGVITKEVEPTVSLLLHHNFKKIHNFKVSDILYQDILYKDKEQGKDIVAEVHEIFDSSLTIKSPINGALIKKEIKMNDVINFLGSFKISYAKEVNEVNEDNEDNEVNKDQPEFLSGQEDKSSDVIDSDQENDSDIDSIEGNEGNDSVEGNDSLEEEEEVEYKQSYKDKYNFVGEKMTDNQKTIKNNIEQIFKTMNINDSNISFDLIAKIENIIKTLKKSEQVDMFKQNELVFLIASCAYFDTRRFNFQNIRNIKDYVNKLIQGNYLSENVIKQLLNSGIFILQNENKIVKTQFENLVEKGDFREIIKLLMHLWDIKIREMSGIGSRTLNNKNYEPEIFKIGNSDRSLPNKDYYSALNYLKSVSNNKKPTTQYILGVNYDTVKMYDVLFNDSFNLPDDEAQIDWGNCISIVENVKNKLRKLLENYPEEKEQQCIKYIITNLHRAGFALKNDKITNFTATKFKHYLDEVKNECRNQVDDTYHEKITLKNQKINKIKSEKKKRYEKREKAIKGIKDKKSYGGLFGDSDDSDNDDTDNVDNVSTNMDMDIDMDSDSDSDSDPQSGFIQRPRLYDAPKNIAKILKYTNKQRKYLTDNNDIDHTSSYLKKDKLRKMENQITKGRRLATMKYNKNKKEQGSHDQEKEQGSHEQEEEQGHDKLYENFKTLKIKSEKGFNC